MGTKTNPGVWDCYQNAEPDEPMFVLLARDKNAPDKVRRWADEREAAGEDPRKVQEARECADAMEAWRQAKRGLVPSPVPVHVVGGAFAGATVHVYFTNRSGLLDCRFAADFGAHREGEIVVLQPTDVEW